MEDGQPCSSFQFKLTYLLTYESRLSPPDPGPDCVWITRHFPQGGRPSPMPSQNDRRYSALLGWRPHHAIHTAQFKIWIHGIKGERPGIPLESSAHRLLWRSDCLPGVVRFSDRPQTWKNFDKLADH